MKIRILRMGETVVYLHAGVLLYGVYVLMIGQGRLMLTAGVSIILHELAHSLAAAVCGYPPDSIELTPVGAVMRMRDDHAVPPLKSFCIVLVGPCMTLTLCCLSLWLAKAGCLHAESARLCFMNNLSILLVNLLPIMPMDGGRILMLMLRGMLREDTARTVMRSVSTVAGAALIMLNLWLTWSRGGWNLSLACTGCFVIYAGSVSAVSGKLNELRELMDRKIRFEQKAAHPCCLVYASDSLTLRHAVKILHPRKRTVFVRTGEQQICLTDEESVIGAYLRTPGGLVKDSAENA